MQRVRSYVIKKLCTLLRKYYARTVLCVYYYVHMCFLAHRHFFLFRPRVFLVLSAPWHAKSPPKHQGASVGPGRLPWHVLWGFKVASPHGEAFRARRAIQAPANPRTVKKCPTAHVIPGILNAISVVRHYLLGDGEVFPRHQHARHATTFSTIR